MTPTTRRSVLAAVGACLSTAGCISDSDGTDPEESTTSERPPGTTTKETTTSDDPETTGDWIEQASNEPDPDLPIYLNNDADEARAVRVRVVRDATNETVFEETRDVPGGTEVELYNLKQADPEGVEAFRVCGELSDSDEGATTNGTTASETANQTTVSETTTEKSETRGCETVETNECYGTAHVAVEEDGSLAVFYSIC